MLSMIGSISVIVALLAAIVVTVAGIVGGFAFFRRSIWAVVRTVFRIKRPREDAPK